MADLRNEVFCEKINRETRTKVSASGVETFGGVQIYLGPKECQSQGECGLDDCEILKAEMDKVVKHLQDEHEAKIKRREEEKKWDF